MFPRVVRGLRPADEVAEEHHELSSSSNNNSNTNTNKHICTYTYIYIYR